jgi:holo-[acyl-carrier protein] synthase
VTPRVTADPAGGPAQDLAARLGVPGAAVAADAGAATGAAGPSVVGVGIDAVDLARFRTVLDRRPRLARRLFGDAELAYAATAPDPLPRLATRFAAKEAVMKALGVGLWSFRLTDVTVARDGLEAPRLALSGAAADLAAARGVTRWHLSLTHTDTVAMAVVVAEGPGRAGTGD